MYATDRLDYFQAQSLGCRITSQFSASRTRKTKFPMRTTDVGRSGAPSFVCDVYAFNMTSHRLPVQVDQLIDIDLVTITKDTVGITRPCCLCVCVCVCARVCTLTYFHGMTPEYLCVLVPIRNTSSKLRSSSYIML